MVQPLWKRVQQLIKKNGKKQLPCNPVISLLNPKEVKAMSQKGICQSQIPEISLPLSFPW